MPSPCDAELWLKKVSWRELPILLMMRILSLFSLQWIYEKNLLKNAWKQRNKNKHYYNYTYYYTRDNNCYKDQNYVGMILLLCFYALISLPLVKLISDKFTLVLIPFSFSIVIAAGHFSEFFSRWPKPRVFDSYWKIFENEGVFWGWKILSGLAYPLRLLFFL